MRHFYKVFFAVITGSVAFSVSVFAQPNNVGIGTNTPNASSILEMQSTSQGVLVPRMTTAQRLAIPAPANGLLVYDTNFDCFFYYIAATTSWQNMCSASGGTGPTGPTGPAGSAGPTGPSGLDGATGPTGSAGPAGPSGLDGATGPTGAAGANGATGSTGVAGANGATGPTGTAGANGATGATGAAGANGATGPTGAAGTNGTNGATGPTGAAGTNGTNGATGPTGAAGTNGTNGATGPTGAAGTNGTNGATGPTGPTADVSSVSLAANYNVTAAAWANVPGMSLTFTATKASVYVVFTAAGFGYTNSMSYVQFRIRNTTSATTVGGTMTHIQDYDDITGTVTPWSCSFTKMLNGLVIGNSYTLQVQAQRNGILGTYDAVINASTDPDSEHMTLSVLQ